MYSKNNHNFETSFNQTINLIKQSQNQNSQNLSTITNMYVDNNQMNQYGSGLSADFITRNTISDQELDIETKFTDNKLEITKFTTKIGTHGNYSIIVDITGKTKHTITQIGLSSAGSSASSSSVPSSSVPSSSVPISIASTSSTAPILPVIPKAPTSGLPSWNTPVNIADDITSTLPVLNPFVGYEFSKDIPDPTNSSITIKITNEIYKT